MDDTWNRRTERRDLADRLMVEYAGAVPPGQILAAVTRAHRIVTSTGQGRSTSEMDMCEALARRTLADRIIHAASLVPAAAS